MYTAAPSTVPAGTGCALLGGKGPDLLSQSVYTSDTLNQHTSDSNTSSSAPLNWESHECLNHIYYFFLKGGGGSCAQCISLFIEHIPVLIIWNNNILPLEYFFWSFIWVEVLMYEASVVGQWWIDVLLHQGTIVHPLKLEGYKGQRCKRLFPCSRKCQNCLFEECYIGSKVYIRNLCIQRPLYFVYV